MSYPPYVNRPAESVHLQPYACHNTQLYGFYLRGNKETIQQKLVDPILNAPTGGATLHWKRVTTRAGTLVPAGDRLFAWGSSSEVLGAPTEPALQALLLTLR